MADDSFECIVEIPKGSRNKYEFDHHRDVIKLDRFLFSSVVYPTDYGFVPDTLSLDEVPNQLQNEITHFFLVYKQLENKKVEVKGWYSREDAIKEIKASRERFKENSH